MKVPKECEASEHEYYAAERDELGFEDGTDMKDDGSEPSEKVTEATDTAWLDVLQQRAAKTMKDTDELIDATTLAFCSLSRRSSDLVRYCPR
jgi:Fe-S-cluster formation regulator IscX/YfhJ